MTIGQRIFHLLDEKKMTQKEFSDRTGIATTTISDWRKKNTNPGSEKIMAICAALEVTPEFLLSGVTEDSARGNDVDYMVIPKGTEERALLEMFNGMDFVERAHMMEYAQKISEKKSNYLETAHKKSMVKIAEFCDVEVFIDSEFEGEPAVDINYIDDDVRGSIGIFDGIIQGDFSKYVRPVIDAWYKDNKEALLSIWNNRKIKAIPAWE
ncbi:XRE family transcriptional regulator [Butyrivibrio sp. CB08]|uniref:helix-turn-helix domain-containing protein n=1 Tax=Butyrivibrio sp. CB08 TaxID=2364879 RepID=UPI000EA8B9F1|nr:helix-turn-helix transcriptional regulator [Butyrivibrio sp. CB08]RKM61441.1 XRE family transcriptional regulator [Butyrivibrio sp. CB08]